MTKNLLPMEIILTTHGTCLIISRIAPAYLSHNCPMGSAKNEVIMINAWKLIRAQHGELKFDRRPSYIIAPRCGRIIPELRSRMRWNCRLQLIILNFRLQYKTVHGKLQMTRTKEKLSTVTDITKTYLRTHECLKTEGPVPIGNYTNTYKRRLHLFMPKAFGKQKIP